jgi:hypothetical protein
MHEVFSVTKGKICYVMVIVIATLQEFYNTTKILYKYNYINYVKNLLYHAKLQASIYIDSANDKR